MTIPQITYLPLDVKRAILQKHSPIVVSEGRDGFLLVTCGDDSVITDSIADGVDVLFREIVGDESDVCIYDYLDDSREVPSRWAIGGVSI